MRLSVGYTTLRLLTHYHGNREEAITKEVNSMTDSEVGQPLPEFESHQEMAEWFDTHDFLDYPDEFREVPEEEVRVSPVLSQTLTIRLSSSLFEELRNQAEERGVEATTLAKMWVVERLQSG